MHLWLSVAAHEEEVAVVAPGICFFLPCRPAHRLTRFPLSPHLGNPATFIPRRFQLQSCFSCVLPFFFLSIRQLDWVYQFKEKRVRRIRAPAEQQDSRSTHAFRNYFCLRFISRYRAGYGNRPVGVSRVVTFAKERESACNKMSNTISRIKEVMKN